MAGKEKAGAALASGQKKKVTLQGLVKDIKKDWILYLLLLPGLLSLILFKIGPVGSMVIAFEKFSAFQGVFGSPLTSWQSRDGFGRCM